MDRRYNAVDRVMGRLFDEHDHRKHIGGRNTYGGSSGRGGGSRPSVSRMSRAGAVHGKPVCKRVAGGGTKTTSGLRGQMDYIFNPEKVARIIDPTGRVGRHEDMPDHARRAIIRNWAADWEYTPKTGNTLHLIMSYPRGTTVDQAEAITRDVLHEKFDYGDLPIQYIASIHDDTDNPHAHVIVNRRGADGALFTMRQDTEYSYEGFREAMAAHGERYGLYLDPTFRFERGVTDRQPTRQEQIDAGKEDRAPRQRPRVGDELARAEALVSWSEIAYNAMAVIAHNAGGADDLAEYYANMSELLREHGDDYKMADLSRDELERFDQYVAFNNRAVQELERTLDDKDPAARVPAELELAKTMRDYTQLNPNASYARELHQPPSHGSVYMHERGQDVAALDSPATKEFLGDMERDHGIDAEAVVARLQSGAPNLYIEQRWLSDEANQIARHHDLDLRDLEQQERVFDELSDIHDEMRDRLTDDKILERLPFLQDERLPLRPDPADYTFNKDRDAVDLDDVLHTFRAQGAPAAWIDGNRATLMEELREQREAIDDDYLRDHAEFRDAYTSLLEQSDTGELRFRDPERGPAIVDQVRERAGARGLDADADSRVIAIHIHSEYPDVPHRLADQAAQNVVYAAALADRDRPGPYDRPDRLSFYEARSPNQRLVTNDYDERQELLALIKDNSTKEQYDQIRHGDLRGVEHLTKDPLFARQLSNIVEGDERHTGRTLSRDEEDRFAEHRQYVNEATKTERDRERDNGYER